MHSQINNLFKVLFISAITLLSLNSYAESSKEFGDYVVHYNAFRSDTISPEVAKQYGLARANNRVLINIAVLKKVMNTTGKPTASKVTGYASNLTGQLKQLEFKEITEGIERIKWALDPNSPNELYIGERKLVRDWT